MREVDWIDLPETIALTVDAAVRRLPLVIRQDDPAGGVLRPWARELPLRLQGVLVTAIRGCDGAPKEDDSKHLSRMVRRAILNPADERETENEKGFFGFSASTLPRSLGAFFHSLDQYPLHYIMHLCHASEVIGYCCPDPAIGWFFLVCYRLFCHTMHLYPESCTQMFERLTEDRIAKGTTARNF
jgi:hypothetical protein